jgi:UDP-N-acetylmuramate dehydrogenase
MSGRDQLREDEPMSQHTTWRVGGTADRYYRPGGIGPLSDFLAALPEDEPVTWVGLGSNLLVRDGGIRGTVIAPHLGLTGLEREGERGLRVEVGVACARLAKQCVRFGLGPAAFFIGIPGTLGGALAMNAGAWGDETWSLVRSVQTIDRRGELHDRDAAEYEVGYRSVTAPVGDEWFVAAVLEFPEGGSTTDEQIKDLLAERKAKQPIGQPTCGSVFTNPPGDHAARLIDSAGLKGLTVGGAQVSERHANFIVNAGDATAADIETLIATVRERVSETHGVELVTEVRIVGEAA